MSRRVARLERFRELLGEEGLAGGCFSAAEGGATRGQEKSVDGAYNADKCTVTFTDAETGAMVSCIGPPDDAGECGDGGDDQREAERGAQSPLAGERAAAHRDHDRAALAEEVAGAVAARVGEATTALRAELDGHLERHRARERGEFFAALEQTAVLCAERMREQEEGVGEKLAKLTNETVHKVGVKEAGQLFDTWGGELKQRVDRLWAERNARVSWEEAEERERERVAVAEEERRRSYRLRAQKPPRAPGDGGGGESLAVERTEAVSPEEALARLNMVCN